MRDILGDLDIGTFASDENPMRRAQKAMLTPMAKRFYKDVTVGESGGRHVVLLDGKAVKTPARLPLSFPTLAAAELVAAEFAAQEKEINPGSMPFTRLANSALDGVSAEMAAVADDIRRFAGNDMLCYRASGPQGLVKRQAEVWDRYIDWARERHGARLILAEGVMHVEQPAEAVEAIGAALGACTDPLSLASLHAMTTLTGSALLALAVAHGEVGAEEAWRAAHLEEDWTIEHWGEDREAAERRAARWIEMDAAARMLKAVA